MGGENVSGKRSSDPGDLLPLTPVVLNVLLALADGERHGYGIMLEVKERTGGTVRLGPGTLYGAIKRLKEGGVVRKRLTEITQILQVYCRLAELELVAGGRPKFSAPGEYGMPSDTVEKARDWAEGEAERERKKQEFMGTLEQVTKEPLAVLGG